MRETQKAGNKEIGGKSNKMLLVMFDLVHVAHNDPLASLQCSSKQKDHKHTQTHTHPLRWGPASPPSTSFCSLSRATEGPLSHAHFSLAAQWGFKLWVEIISAHAPSLQPHWHSLDGDKNPFTALSHHLYIQNMCLGSFPLHRHLFSSESTPSTQTERREKTRLITFGCFFFSRLIKRLSLHRWLRSNYLLNDIQF